MSYRFKRMGGTVLRPRYRLISPDPGKFFFVRLLAPPDQAVWDRFHFLPDKFKTVPCRGNDTCPWCPNPTRWIAYMPCLYWSEVSAPLHGEKPFDNGRGAWVKGIMRIVESLDEMLKSDLRGWVLKIWRAGTARNAPCAWRKIEKIADAEAADHEPHDITDTLLRVWGMYFHFKKEPGGYAAVDGGIDEPPPESFAKGVGTTDTPADDDQAANGEPRPRLNGVDAPKPNGKHHAPSGNGHSNGNGNGKL